MHRARVLDDVFAEGVMRLVARRHGRLRRFEAHVVPAKILEISADLAEALRAHGRASRALACEKSGRERSDRLGFVHLAGSLLADDATTEAADGTRTGLADAGRRAWRSEHRAAEILFKTIRDVIPQLDHFLR